MFGLYVCFAVNVEQTRKQKQTCSVLMQLNCWLIGSHCALMPRIGHQTTTFYLPSSHSLWQHPPLISRSMAGPPGGCWLVARLGLGTQLLAIHQLTTSSPAEFDPVQVAPCLCGGRRTFCNKFAHFGGSKHLKHNTGVDTCLAGRGAENNMIYRPAFCKNNKAIKHGRWRKLHKELDID